MPVWRKPLEMVTHPFVQQFLLGQELAEPGELDRGWQLAIDEQPGRLHESAVLGKLLDGITTIAQDPILTVNERDLALTGPCIAVTGIKRDVTGLVAQRSNVDGLLALGPRDDRELDLLSGKLQDGGLELRILLEVLCREQHDERLARES